MLLVCISGIRYAYLHVQECELYTELTSVRAKLSSNHVYEHEKLCGNYLYISTSKAVWSSYINVSTCEAVVLDCTCRIPSCHSMLTVSITVEASSTCKTSYIARAHLPTAGSANAVSRLSIRYLGLPSHLTGSARIFRSPKDSAIVYPPHVQPTLQWVSQLHNLMLADIPFSDLQGTLWFYKVYNLISSLQARDIELT